MKTMLFIFGLIPLALTVATRHFDLMLPATVITLALVSMAKTEDSK